MNTTQIPNNGNGPLLNLVKPFSRFNVSLVNFRLPQKSCDDLSDNGSTSNSSELSNKSSKNRRNLIKRVDHNLKVHFGSNSLLMVDGSNQSVLSHRSTPDSLEWDQQQDHLKSEVDSLDFETKELLNEIELLKNRVLSETGAGLCPNES